MPDASMLAPSDDLIQEALEEWPRIGAWVVTCREQGAMTCWHEDQKLWFLAKRCWVPTTVTGRPERVVGCGSAFTAGFTAAYLTTGSVREASRFAALAAGVQASLPVARFVSPEDLLHQAYLPDHGAVQDISAAWATKAFTLLREMRSKREVRELLPGIVSDSQGLTVKVKRDIEKFLEEPGKPQLLVIGRPGNGKTQLVLKLLKNRRIAFELVNTPEKSMKGTLEKNLSAFVNSDNQVLVLDELLAVEKAIRNLTGSLPEGKLTLGGKTVSLGGKKVIATGSASGLAELSDDVRSRFDGQIVEIHSPDDPSEILDISAVRGKLRQRTVSLYRSMSYGLFCPGTI